VLTQAILKKGVILDKEEDNSQEGLKGEKTEVEVMEFEKDKFGFMMTKVRAAFRLKLIKEAKSIQNSALK